MAWNLTVPCASGTVYLGEDIISYSLTKYRWSMDRWVQERGGGLLSWNDASGPLQQINGGYSQRWPSSLESDISLTPSNNS